MDKRTMPAYSARMPPVPNQKTKVYSFLSANPAYVIGFRFKEGDGFGEVVSVHTIAGEEKRKEVRYVKKPRNLLPYQT
jgi:hypothetical protein